MLIPRFSSSRSYTYLVNFFFRFRYLILVFIIATPIFFLARFGLAILKNANVRPFDILSFFGNTNEKIKENNGITNILVLGIRGEGSSDSPDLSDTFMVISLNQSKNIVKMISFPRDLYLPEFKAKINSLYHYSEEVSPGGGIASTESKVLASLGIPIQYTVIVDFSLFKSLIDQIGGVTVNIPEGFTDPLYPIPGRENAMPISSRYETISFATGSANFNGETALKYVRSRHSVGDTGTDYSRGSRQQAVISAVKDKILTSGILLDQQKVLGLVQLINSKLVTTITPDLYPVFARRLLDMRNATFQSHILSDQKDENGVTILFHPNEKLYKGEWVLIAKDNNWTALRLYLKNLLSSDF